MGWKLLLIFMGNLFFGHRPFRSNSRINSYYPACSHLVRRQTSGKIQESHNAIGQLFDHDPSDLMCIWIDLVKFLFFFFSFFQIFFFDELLTWSQAIMICKQNFYEYCTYTRTFLQTCQNLCVLWNILQQVIVNLYLYSVKALLLII